MLFRKRYLLFGGSHYYPNGGANDFLFSGSLESCKEYFASNLESIKGRCDSTGKIWGQIVDARTLSPFLFVCVEVPKREAVAWKSDDGFDRIDRAPKLPGR